MPLQNDLKHWQFYHNREPLYMILGVTGSFGAGKSTVREEFTASGWYFFDADKVCHDIYDAKDGVFYAGIVNRWGGGILDKKGFIDRKILASKVFGKPEMLAELTAMLYPELERRLDDACEFCRKNDRNGAFEIPLLFEKNYASRFDAVLAVWSAEKIRHDRLKTLRNFSDEDIRKREACQMPSDEKLELADFALINNGSRELLHRQIIFFIKKLQTLENKVPVA